MLQSVILGMSPGQSSRTINVYGGLPKRNIFETREQERVTNIPRFQPELAYPHMSAGMLQRLRRFGQVETFPAGGRIIAQGTVIGDLYVLLDGTSACTGDQSLIRTTEN